MYCEGQLEINWISLVRGQSIVFVSYYSPSSCVDALGRRPPGRRPLAAANRRLACLSTIHTPYAGLLALT
jgi:hypothetical protein